ncbi:sugar ABC transporter substrate-binding protein [Actinomycetes bacterium M1A6_2h]
MQNKKIAVAVAGVGILLAVTACGSNSSGGGSGSSDSGGSSSNGGTKVGVILPDTKSSARYESQDRPLLQKALSDAGLDPIIQNAEGDTTKFSSIADSMISQGAKVILMSNLSSESGAAVQKKAKEAGVATIDYDRLTLGGSADYYVSFDSNTVGNLQGQGLVDCIGAKPGAQVIQIDGSPTDNNATLFKAGALQVLQPKYDSGALRLVGDQAIPEWDNQVGGTTFEQLLTANGGKVDGVLAANDGLAGAVITVLQKNGLNGQVPVTGQDATEDGLKAVLRGDQCMTVFKDVAQEAAAAAELAIDLAKGDTAAADAKASATSEDPTGNRQVKSVLLTPVTITKANVKVAVDGGAVSASDLCSGDMAEACATAGIS